MGKQFQSATDIDSKCQNGTLDCTLEELAVLNLLKEKPSMTQKELAVCIGKSERMIKRITVSLQQKEIMTRADGKRNGKWVLREEAGCRCHGKEEKTSEQN